MTTSHLSLVEIVGVPPIRAELVASCVELVNSEVAAKKGMGGIAIKGAYGAVKRIKPTFVPEVIDTLLDDWLTKMEPYHVEWRAGGEGRFESFVEARSGDVAEDLLSVTDERAEESKHKTARKLYFKLRGSAKANVAGAVGKLGALIERHLADSV